jgi:uncharacterized protein DUF2326
LQLGKDADHKKRRCNAVNFNKFLESEYANIDRQAVEAIYKDAEKFVPTLHHEWTDLADFVQSLRTRKQRFLESQIDDLRLQSNHLSEQLTVLQGEETKELGMLLESPEFKEALKLRSDLQEKLKKLGSLEQDLVDRKNLRASLTENQKKLDSTRKQIEDQKAALANRIGVFNASFSKLSKALYGEEYLLYFTETDKDVLSFRLKAVGENVGGGKKASQTAAFDLAYIAFLHQAGMNFPTFVCHDGVESIHGNQLSALLTEANKIDGQLIIATLRDKLPVLEGESLSANTVLELSQEDKFFRL